MGMTTIEYLLEMNDGGSRSRSIWKKMGSSEDKDAVLDNARKILSAAEVKGEEIELMISSMIVEI